jgi:hypothetical protein
LVSKYEVHLKQTNQTGTLTTNLNGHKLRRGRRYVTLIWEDAGRTVFRIPVENVAYIRKRVEK